MASKIKAYICTTDWNTEIQLGAPDVTIFPTVKDLKARRTCWKECGIVEIEISLKRVVKKGTL